MTIAIDPNKTERLIEPERVPEGYVLSTPSDRISSREDIVLLALWFGIFSSMIAGFFFPLIDSEWSIGGQIYMLLHFLVCIVLFKLAIDTGILRFLMVTAKLKAGEIVLPSYPLRLGESYKLRYRRQLRRGSLSRPGTINAKWFCYERAQHDSGSDTHTVTHTLCEIDLPEQSVSAGTCRIEYNAQVEVHPQYPPSFDAAHNQVIWELRVSMKLPGIPRNTSHFQMKIIPEIV